MALAVFAPAFQESGDCVVTFALSAIAGGQLPVTRHQEKERITRFAFVGGGISDYLVPHPVAVLQCRALS